MKKYNKSESISKLSKIVGLIIGTGGIIAGFWDMVAGTYFIVLGMWLYLVCGD